MLARAFPFSGVLNFSFSFPNFCFVFLGPSANREAVKQALIKQLGLELVPEHKPKSKVQCPMSKRLQIPIHAVRIFVPFERGRGFT